MLIFDIFEPWLLYYIEADALLNLLNELRKSDKNWGLSSILSLFCKEFKK